MSVSTGLFSSLEPLDVAIPNIKGMIYGDSGVGKTVCGLQLAQRCNLSGKDILYIDAVEGWVSLRNHPGTLNKVQRMTYQGLSQLDAVADFVKNNKEPLNNVGTIIIDEMSTVAKLDLDTVLKGRALKDASKDADVPTQPDYLANTERSRRTMLRLFKLDVNIIILSHVREEKEEATGLILTRPSLTPKFSETLREMLHFVVHMSADNTVKGSVETYTRKLQVHPTKKIVAKTRIGGFKTFTTPDNFIDTAYEWLTKGGEPASDTPTDSEPIDSELIELD